MKKSSFQFKNPNLETLEYKENNDFIPILHECDKTENEINVQVRSETTNTAIVTVVLDINKDCPQAPFQMHIVMSSTFKWDESLAESMVQALLHQNAPALLLSYMRPIIAGITSVSKFGGYNLPYFDFT